MSDIPAVKRSRTLDDLLTNEYGVNTHPGPETRPVVVGVAVSQVCSNNPNRVGLTFINLGSNNIYLYLNNGVSATQGILCAGGGGVVAFNWRDDMTLISNDWYATAPGGNTSLQVVEVVTK